MFYITGTYFFRRWHEFTVDDILWYVLKLLGQLANLKWMKYFNFLLFYNDLYLNNQKILCLPLIYQFERKVGFWTTLYSMTVQFCLHEMCSSFFFGEWTFRKGFDPLCSWWRMPGSDNMCPFGQHYRRKFRNEMMEFYLGDLKCLGLTKK